MRPDVDVSRLRRRLDGDVILPDDSDYEEARSLWIRDVANWWGPQGVPMAVTFPRSGRQWIAELCNPIEEPT